MLSATSDSPPRETPDVERNATSKDSDPSDANGSSSDPNATDDPAPLGAHLPRTPPRLERGPGPVITPFLLGKERAVETVGRRQSQRKRRPGQMSVEPAALVADAVALENAQTAYVSDDEEDDGDEKEDEEEERSSIQALDTEQESYRNPEVRNPENRNPEVRNPEDRNPEDRNPGDRNPGDRNRGNRIRKPENAVLTLDRFAGSMSSEKLKIGKRTKKAEERVKTNGRRAVKRNVVHHLLPTNRPTPDPTTHPTLKPRRIGITFRSHQHDLKHRKPTFDPTSNPSPSLQEEVPSRHILPKSDFLNFEKKSARILDDSENIPEDSENLLEDIPDILGLESTPVPKIIHHNGFSLARVGSTERDMDTCSMLADCTLEASKIKDFCGRDMQYAPKGEFLLSQWEGYASNSTYKVTACFSDSDDSVGEGDTITSKVAFQCGDDMAYLDADRPLMVKYLKHNGTRWNDKDISRGYIWERHTSFTSVIQNEDSRTILVSCTSTSNHQTHKGYSLQVSFTGVGLETSLFADINEIYGQAATGLCQNLPCNKPAEFVGRDLKRIPYPYHDLYGSKVLLERRGLQGAFETSPSGPNTWHENTLMKYIGEAMGVQKALCKKKLVTAQDIPKDRSAMVKLHTACTSSYDNAMKAMALCHTSCHKAGQFQRMQECENTIALNCENASAMHDFAKNFCLSQ